MGDSFHSHVEAALSQQDRDNIQRHLEWLLETAPFGNSKRSCSFLRYVVEEALAGRSSQIKERNIGVDVFSKDVGFDPQEDSVVRVGAGDVRRRLSRTYASGAFGGVRIELPVGSYCPIFHIEPAIAPDPAPEPFDSQPPVTLVPPVLPPARNARSFRWGVGAWIGVAAFVCLAILGLGISSHIAAASRSNSLDTLWHAFSGQKLPVLIALPSPTVYSVRTVPAPSDLVPASNLQRSDGDYIGIGAGIGAARFAEQLALRHQPFVVKSGKDVSFSDLSQAPAILLGGYSSNLGIELTRSFRFSLLIDATTDRIVDNQGAHQQWVIARWTQPVAAHEGYALITILRDSETGHPLMIVAGMRISDTQAAVDFLTNPDYFRAYTQKAPGDWAKKNNQIVLHSFDHGGTPGRAEIVAWHLW